MFEGFLQASSIPSQAPLPKGLLVSQNYCWFRLALKALLFGDRSQDPSNSGIVAARDVKPTHPKPLSEYLKVMIMMRSAIALACLILNSLPLAAQEADPDLYSEGRAIITEASRIVTPQGIEETFVANIGELPHVVNVRGKDRSNPIIVFLHGGPGSTAMPVSWSFQQGWEDFFTVVHFDQRGAGRTFRLNGGAGLQSNPSADRYVADAIEVIEVIRQRYAKNKVVLLGHSWGSVIGLSVASRRPDLLHAYVGVGQLIDFRRNEEAGYAWTLAEAQRRGNLEAIRELQAIAPYPGDGPLSISSLVTERKWNTRFGGQIFGREDGSVYFDAVRLSPEYDARDRAAMNEGMDASGQALFPTMRQVSFWDVSDLEVPVVMLLGREDRVTSATLTQDWMSRLDAPVKEIVLFDNSAHFPMIEEPGKFLFTLVERVLPLTSGVD